ncbi:TonB-dependent receptor domain-containing protein [Luteimonas sp. R10]|uniref:TonB-dependent receptor domain-containing protein n=1 Tax=Luteimonas sp. R10 TaxID=3108176 RepID=UPI00308B58AB|nr:TonB-dependent receptor [Luteimonas sp. R10]
MSRLESRCLFAAAVSLAFCAAPVALYAQVTYDFDLPAQSLADSLRAVGSKGSVNVAFEPATVQGRLAPALKGSYSARQALERLLEDSGLVVRTTEGGSFLVEAQQGETDGERAQTPPGSADDPLATGLRRQSTSHTMAVDVKTLDDVVVTGTNLRGATLASLASPIRIVEREEIDRSGYATTGDVIRSLPQAFAGNQNPGAFPIGGMAPANNFSAASSADLRGLGPGATLTLLNGRRLAYNGYANTVDVGMIPLPALDRVEVVTDGASAIYGSDAVAGVVNFILRDDFEGAETTVRFGGSSRGGAAERQFSQLVGKSWSTGNVLLNVERYEQEALYADQRDVSQAQLDPSTLLPVQGRTSVLLMLNQDITPQVSFFTEALYSRKDVEGGATYSYSPPTIFNVRQTTDTSQYGINAGLKFALPADWRGEASVSLSRNKEDFLEIHNVYEPYAVFFENRLRGAELTAEGPLFALPAGRVTSAFGVGYRGEELDGFFVNSAQRGERSVEYAYGELSIPVHASALGSVNLSASGRYESYDDFGSVFNPKLGLVYLHGTSFKLRGSWGKSFRAPSLYQVHGAREATLYNASTFQVPGAAPDALAIYLSGANPDLGPEQSRSWTAGADFTPDFASGLRVSATYFEIDYRDRIVSGGNTIGVWDNPQFQHMVIKHPAADYLEALLQPPTRFNNSLGVPFDPEKVVGVFMVNQRNAPSQDIRGVDLSGSYEWNAGDGYFNAFADMSWLDIRQIDTPGSPERTLTGYVYFPAKRRARAGLNWSRGGIAATGIVSHVSGSTDNTGEFISGAENQDVPVGSWTTLDAQLSYDTGDGDGLTSGLRLSLSARNLLDRPPPAVAGASGGPLSRGLGFDPQNASALGRFVSLMLSKRW